MLAWSPAFVLVVGIAATAALAVLADRGTYRDSNQRFDHLSLQLAQALRARMDTYQNALVHTRGLFMSDPQLSREKFRDFVAALDVGKKYPGLRGINFSVAVPPGGREALEKSIRAEGYPDFRIWPEPDDGDDETVALIYLEPQQPSILRAMGLNSYSESTRREAMERARDTGLPAVSRTVNLIQDSADFPRTGFVLYVPVYRAGAPTQTVEQRREALTGFIHGLLRTDLLFGTVADSFVERSLIDVSIYDGETIEPARLIFETPARAANVLPLPERTFSKAMVIDVEGVKWTILVRSLPGFEPPFTALFPWLVVLVGLLSTAVLYASSHAAARLIADKQRLLDEARKINRSKDDFLAMLSHELRTPLGVIQGHAEVLMDADGPAEVRDSIEAIHRNARVQTRIIDDLLEVSSIVTGKLRLDPRPVDVGALLEAAVDGVRFAAQAKSILLDVHAGNDLVADADPTRLQQVFWNLLSNAVKFTPPGGRVEAFTVRKETECEIHVRDSGQGIEAAFLPHVFDRFRQQDGGTTRRFGGLGLGLAIVQNLVHLHGGKVEARSDGPGQGAEFVVTLPLVEAAARLSEPKPARRADGARLDGARVLVVDDDRDSRAMIAKALEQAGAVVHLAASTAEALPAFRDFRPNLVVSDIGMPDEDGYALIRRVREDESILGRPVTPAIALTAYAEPRGQLETLKAGFQAHLVKPVDTHELTEAAAQLLRPFIEFPRLNTL